VADATLTLSPEQVEFLIPLRAATLENGCMQFVPGTHRQEVLPHYLFGNDPRIIGLEVDSPERLTAGAVACPIPAGGAAVHHSRMLHFTGPNRSDQQPHTQTGTRSKLNPTNHFYRRRP